MSFNFAWGDCIGSIQKLLSCDEGWVHGTRRTGTGRRGRWLVGPAFLVEPRGRVAPRPVVGLGDVATKSGHECFVIDLAGSDGELGLRVSLANLVRVETPKGIESAFARFFLSFLRFYLCS